MLFGHAGPSIVLGHLLMDTEYIPQESGKWGIRAGTCSVSKYTKIVSPEVVRPGLGVWRQDWNGKTDFLTDGEEVCLLSLHFQVPKFSSQSQSLSFSPIHVQHLCATWDGFT